MATAPAPRTRDRFEELLGPGRVIDHPLERRLYARDGSIAQGECGLVVLPETTAEVVACVRLAAELGLPVVPRGSGTGLCGGAVPLDGALVMSVARMTRIVEIDPAVPCARVEPGVLNLDLSTAVRHLGLHYAPDPSSQGACSIGGNVATNAGGPHCLASGVTAQHVLGMEIVLADGEVLRLGGTAPDPPGYDLRGFVVGGEGTLGVVTEVTVRLSRTPPAVRTMLLDFPTVRAAGEAVGGIVAAGVIPAAMEMMDRLMTVAVEEFVHAGLPVDAAAILLVEVDGTPAEVAANAEVVERVAREAGARGVRAAADEAERALLWKARKSAFGAVARIAPNYYLHDCVVPRTRLVEILERIEAIAAEHDLVIMNVFHAGDGNLHPLIAFDRRDAAQVARVHAAGAAIIEACVAAGGVLSGEHGIGLEKRDFMPLTFSDVDLAAQACARDAFDPTGRMNPAKVLPVGSRCGELVLDAGALPAGTWL
ncbi:FAD-binding oxidoreductase [Miltoncostaea marina]|uniref:FAD-binding oxidoreductase n=1 Tax=Miltoncostaea marina TaxID=2843215 RepID=UPI001C3D9E71|nr:FAD-linked oxidase C-terminal domain-containing protein [Miltoncostaea marina]